MVRLSIRFHGVVVALACLVVAYGIYSLHRTNLDVFPEFSPTQVVIQTEATGLSTELVETLVTQPIENGIAGTVGVEAFRSQSIPGLSVVTVVFREGTDIHRNRQAIAERIGTLVGKLPGVVPNITPLTSSASTVLGIGLTSTTRSLMDLRSFVDWTLKPHLLAVPGIADVNVFGGEVRELQIQVVPEKLIRQGLSLEDVRQAAARVSGVIGAGYLENDNQRIVIHTEGQSSGTAQIAQGVIVHREGRGLRLGDIANVVEAAAPSISAAAIDGKPGVYISLQGQLGANTRAVTEASEKALRELEPALAAEGITLHSHIFRPANFIETAIAGVKRDILIGSVLVVTVLFLFLFNVRTAFISATAIPLSLLAAILVLAQFGFGLNIMVLGGLAIALGEVVDDAIIDTENIFRRLRENLDATNPQPVHEVVFSASMEVRGSVVYATIIVAMVFLPLLTLSGVAGKLFAPLGLAYIFAILASLVVALTLTPALCYLLFARGRLESTDPPPIRLLKSAYTELLRMIERNHRLTIGIVAMVIALGLGILPLFKSQFIPDLKEGHYILHMTAVPGTSEKESLRLGAHVTESIAAIDGVKSVAQWVGRAQNGADTFGTHYSEFEIEIGTRPGDEQTRILEDIRAALTDYPGVSFAINTFLTERIEETISGFTAAMVVNIHGSNLDTLDRDARTVAGLMATIHGAADIQIQSPPGTPQLTVRLSHERLALHGFKPVDVLEAVRLAFEGTQVAQVFEGNRILGVRVILDTAARQHIGEVGKLALRNADGRIVRLAELADIAQSSGRGKILHLGGKRIQTVSCNIVDRDLHEFADELRRKVATASVLSLGNFPTFTGAAEAQAQAREDLVVNSLLAGVGIFLMLYIAFGRLRNLLLTCLNLPFALVGGVLATLFTGGWLSLGSLVGFVTLFGITLRNSIMLVSHYQYLVQVEGMNWGIETAIRGASERLPSILMTALVTGLGLLPLALGSGEPGREIEGPMAKIIVGGLITSTALNLLILPTIMLHFGRFEKKGLS